MYALPRRNYVKRHDIAILLCLHLSSCEDDLEGHQTSYDQMKSYIPTK